MFARTILMTGAALVALAAALPALAETVTLRLVSKDLSLANPQDVAHIDRIEQALAARGTMVDIEIIEIASAGYADKLTAMILAGDIPDLIYFQGGDAKIAEQGVLEDLRPWIENSEFLKDALYPHNRDRLENYPYLLYVFPVRNSQPVMRQDWFERTGLPAPQTVEDYVALLTAAAQGDFDGDGQANTLGLTAAETTAELDAIFNPAFGITATWLETPEGFINARISPQERDKIAFYASLREQGLLDPEYITTKWDVKEDKFYSGRVAMILGSSAEVIDIYGGKMRQVHPGVELVLFDPPQGPGGRGLAAVDVSKESRGFAISALSEHKEEAFAVLDFMASPEGQMMDRMGFEGEEYTVVDGQVQVTDKIATWYARFMVAANWTPPVQWLSPAAQQHLANVGTFYVADNAFVWPPEFAADLDATTNVYREWVYKFISGEAGMDQWDTYVAEWNAAGGERLTAHAQEVLNASN
jgi:putative aldouronate transport system substrate-binding protein